MLKTRRVRGRPAQFSRQLTQWGLTLLVILTLFFSAFAAYNAMVGKYTVSPAATRKPPRQTFVDGPRLPTPAQRHRVQGSGFVVRSSEAS